MVSFPTGIPKSLVQSLKRVFSGTVLDILWRLFVITVGGLFLYGLLAASGGFFVAFLVSTVLGIVFSDNIRAFILDVWHRRFWVFRA